MNRQYDPAARSASVRAAPSVPASPLVSAPGTRQEERHRRPARRGRSHRRFFLISLVATPFAWGWTLMTATIGVSLLAMIRFLFPNLLVERPARFKVGPPSDYPPGTVSTKWKASHGIWIVHSDAYRGRDEIYALVAECTHLGCTPLWQETEQKFKCP
ncbi:MAG TPA: hypothetical protein EYP14_01075, partial [Planctomycetaceae bacterium]|nr:hypothetical protein [Planctomycetaceae bacterium]